LSGVGTPLEFAEKISRSLNLKPEEVDDLFTIDEDKNGYFVATLYPKKFLNKEQFKMMCGLVKDLNGEAYLQGAKSWMIAGPMAKKSPIPIQEEIPKGVVGSDEDYDLKASVQKVGHLYPVLTDSFGNVIDGFHRLDVDPNWPKVKVDSISDPVQLTIARLIANTRRDVPPEEKKEGLTKLIKMTGWSPKQLAENLGWNIRTVYRYLPDDLKGPEPEELSRDRVSRGMDKTVSVATLKPQDMTEGQIREFLDSPKVKEVAASIQSPTSPTESIPSPDINSLGTDSEPNGDSEEPVAGSSEPHRHKLEGTQVGEFHCSECDQHFFIDHISADKHRLTKVRSAPE